LSKDAFPLKDRVGYKVYLEGLKRGVFMRPLGDVIYFIPPLIITNEEIEIMMNAAFESIEAVLG
jgi:adenosylmethionine-8-amino-7-oxononanoate aminotransferase